MHHPGGVMRGPRPGDHYARVMTGTGDSGLAQARARSAGPG